MDIEKLIEAVKLCGSTPKVDQCKQCAYWSGGDMSKCIPRMTTDAATALQYLSEGADEVNATLQEQIAKNVTLQAENTQLRAELEQVKAERDAAIEDIRGDCEKCAHYRVTWNGCTPDFECPLFDQCLNRDMWEWRGPQKED